jgi:hypothetical protein
MSVETSRQRSNVAFAPPIKGKTQAFEKEF